MTKKYKNLLKKHAAVTILRNKIGFYNVHGYLLDISSNWILLQNILEFHLDGYYLIRMSDIDKIRYDQTDKYIENILKTEGVKKNISIKYKINIADTFSIFKYFKENKLIIIVECERKKNDSFFIGRVIQVNKNSLSMLHFDACGKWSRQSAVIPYQDITLIRFDEEYINVFSKYLRN